MTVIRSTDLLYLAGIPVLSGTIMAHLFNLFTGEIGGTGTGPVLKKQPSYDDLTVPALLQSAGRNRFQPRLC